MSGQGAASSEYFPAVNAHEGLRVVAGPLGDDQVALIVRLLLDPSVSCDHGG